MLNLVVRKVTGRL